MQNPQNLYTEILTTSLEKLRKALPKKHKDIKEMIQTFQGFPLKKAIITNNN